MVKRPGRDVYYYYYQYTIKLKPCILCKEYVDLKDQQICNKIIDCFNMRNKLIKDLTQQRPKSFEELYNFLIICKSHVFAVITTIIYNYLQDLAAM